MGFLDSLFGPRDPEEFSPGASPMDVSGRTRDILGGLGDAFLTQAGEDPRYAKKRAAEEISSIMGNFDTDPMAAIAKVSRVDPEAGDTLLQRYQARLKQQEDNAVATGDLRRKNLDTNTSVEGQTYSQVAGLLRATKDNPAAYERAADVARELAKRRGVTLPIDPGKTYDAGILSAYDNIAMTPDQAYDNRLNRDKYVTDAAMDAARIGVSAGRTVAGISNASARTTISAHKPTGKGKGTSGGIARPVRPAGGGGKPFKFNATSGKVEYRQPDGSYKPR